MKYMDRIKVSIRVVHDCNDGLVKNKSAIKTSVANPIHPSMYEWFRSVPSPPNNRKRNIKMQIDR